MDAGAVSGDRGSPVLGFDVRRPLFVAPEEEKGNPTSFSALGDMLDGRREEPKEECSAVFHISRTILTLSKSCRPVEEVGARASFFLLFAGKGNTTDGTLSRVEGSSTSKEMRIGGECNAVSPARKLRDIFLSTSEGGREPTFDSAEVKTEGISFFLCRCM